MSGHWACVRLRSCASWLLVVLYPKPHLPQRYTGTLMLSSAVNVMTSTSTSWTQLTSWSGLLLSLPQSGHFAELHLSCMSAARWLRTLRAISCCSAKDSR